MSKRPRIGRPPKAPEDRFDLVHVRLPKPMIRKIDDYRRSRDDAPDRSSAIREFIREGFIAKGLSA